jgi:hypothetical protein
MSTTIRINGMDELMKKINSLEQMDGVKHAMRAAALHVKGKIAEYPPESDANRAGRIPSWYERGWGTKWNLAGGGTGGVKTSETLGRRWTIGQRNNGLTQIIGNNVSYGPAVQDPAQQSATMKRIGWKTTKQVADEEAATVVKFIQDEIDKILNGP